MKAIDKAMFYLNIKPRTEKQIRDYLAGKGYEDDEISEAVDQLMEYHYLDDVQYARMFFELGFEKGRGNGRIRRELAEKGVSKADIEAAYESLEEMPDEYDMAYSIGQSVISGMDDINELDYKEKQKLQAKIARRLASRGFSPDIVFSVAKELVR